MQHRQPGNIRRRQAQPLFTRRGGSQHSLTDLFGLCTAKESRHARAARRQSPYRSGRLALSSTHFTFAESCDYMPLQKRLQGKAISQMIELFVCL